MTEPQKAEQVISNELVIDVSASEVAIAWLKDKRLVELNKEVRNIHFAVGDIYIGKVKKIMPGLNAAFVDVGYEKDAFLHYLDLGPQIKSLTRYVGLNVQRKGKLITTSNFKNEPDIPKEGKISDILTAGQPVLVQIATEPISTKGPRLSAELSIAGRNLVIIPFSDMISVSQKIRSKETRERVKKLIESVKPANYGVIIRTVAEGKDDQVIIDELHHLVQKWETAVEALKTYTGPKLILSELNRTSAMLRDLLNSSFSNIYVNDEAFAKDLRQYIDSIAPEEEKIVKYLSEGTPIFERFGITKQSKALFGKTVSIKNGIYLIIEHTEALHVIDVNSGNRSKSGADQETNAFEVNLTAAVHIAQQLRLRDLGGIIVIDFIDMYKAEHRTALYERMKAEMADDRAKHNILPITKFGLMQITRQRVRPETTVQTTEKCPTCHGTGKVDSTILFEDELLRRITEVVEQRHPGSLTLHLHPYVAAYLTKGFRSIRRQWARSLHCRLNIVPDSEVTMLDLKCYDRNGDLIPTNSDEQPNLSRNADDAAADSRC